MPTRRMSAGQTSMLLRQLEVQTETGKTTHNACREARIPNKSHCWRRNEYGDLDMDQAKLLKELDKKNNRLRRVAPDFFLRSGF